MEILLYFLTVLMFSSKKFTEFLMFDSKSVFS